MIANILSGNRVIDMGASLPKSGIAWADEDHAMVYGIIAKTKLAMAAKNWRMAKRLHKTAIVCALEHIQKEERLMRETRYPDLEGHAARHKELIDGFVLLYSHLNDRSNPEAMFDILAKIEHAGISLMHEDAKFAEFLRAQAPLALESPI